MNSTRMLITFMLAAPTNLSEQQTSHQQQKTTPTRTASPTRAVAQKQTQRPIPKLHELPYDALTHIDSYLTPPNLSSFARSHQDAYDRIKDTIPVEINTIEELEDPQRRSIIESGRAVTLVLYERLGSHKHINRLIHVLRSYKNMNIVSADFSFNNMGAHALQKILSVPHWDQLQVLDLAYNDLNPEGAMTIASHKALNNIQVLNLAGNYLKDLGIDMITQAAFPDLTYLDLSNNYIGPMGIVQLSNFFLTHNKLNVLSLCNNQINDRTAEIFAVLMQGTSLRILDLSDNDISSLGVKRLIELEFFKNLEQLILQSNDIDEETQKQLTAIYGPKIVF